MAEVINKHLDNGERVLWLIPGGSSIEVAILTAEQLTADLSNLTVSLTDERYGPVGHADSNWRQLQAAGLKLPGAKLQPVLNGESLERTTASYCEFLQTNFDQADYAIGLTGIGIDGHTVGIKPHSPALESQQLVCGYQAEDYQRLSITPKAIRHLDEMIVYAVGQEKWPVLEALKQNLAINEQPAQILKQVPKLIIFNDLKGEQL